MPQRLAQHLIARGLLPARVVDEALRRAARENVALDTVLLELGAVSEAGILQAISDVSGVRLVNLADFEPNHEAGPLMPLKMARQLNVVPLSVDGTALHVACAYPLNQAQLKDVGFLLGRKLELWMAIECRVRDWQHQLYGQKPEPRYLKLLAQLDPTRPRLPAGPAGGDTETLSREVIDRASQGIVEEPLLLDKPKKKPAPAKPRPKIEIVEEPVAVSGPVSVPVALGDEVDEPKTSVLDPTAYSRFARAEHGRGLETSTSGTPLEEHDSTRVLDITGYQNFAKEFSTSAPVQAPAPVAPVPPPPRISFPGGVLPPRKGPGDAAPVRRAGPAPTFVQPALAPRPIGDRIRPGERRAVEARAPVKPAAPAVTAAPAAPVDEMDFSDVNVAVVAPPSAPPARPAPASDAAVPSEAPTPPDDERRDLAEAPAALPPPPAVEDELSFASVAAPAPVDLAAPRRPGAVLSGGQERAPGAPPFSSSPTQQFGMSGEPASTEVPAPSLGALAAEAAQTEASIDEIARAVAAAPFLSAHTAAPEPAPSPESGDAGWTQPLDANAVAEAARWAGQPAGAAPAWPSGGDGAQQAWDQAAAAQQQAWDQSTEAAPPSWDQATDTGQPPSWDQATDTGQQAGSQPTEAAQQAWSQPTEAAQQAWSQPTDGAQQAWSQPADAAQQAWSQPADGAQQVWSQPADGAQQAWNQPADGAQQAWSQPADTAQQGAPQPAPSAPSAAALAAAQARGLLPSPPGLQASPATEWNLAQARASLKAAAHDREALITVVLDYARRTFEYAGAFAVMRGAAVGWDSRSDDDVKAIRELAVPLDAASVFRTVALTRGSYVGPPPPDALSQHYLALLGRAPRTVFLWPVEVQSRLVAVLYGDCGGRPISQRRLADFILFCQDLPSAFHELILFRKQNPQAAQHFTSASGIMPDPGYAAEGAGQAPVSADDEWFGGLIQLLTGPDPSERSMAMMELLKAPEASAQALARVFPGPTGWSRLPVAELPEPDELGPVPGALARLGMAAATALAPLLEHPDSDTRYLALLTAGSLRYPDVVDGVLRGLFDFEPDLSSAARAAAAALKRLPHFQSRMPVLREQLASPDALHASLAARALGVLHDRESIDALIDLTASPDELCAHSASDALKEITRAGYGADREAWLAWWAAHGGQRRIEWLVEALGADDFDLRLAAVEELSRTFGDNFGYFADGPDAERAAASGRWQAIVASRPDLEL